MEGRRAFLKEIASRSAGLWGLVPLPRSLAGESRLETRNSMYRLRDGVCYRVDRGLGRPNHVDPCDFIGMRVVGWLLRDDPTRTLSLEWHPGALAVLWRPRGSSASRSAVAMTSPSIAFRQVPTSSPRIAARSASRPSIPPPLPARVAASGPHAPRSS